MQTSNFWRLVDGLNAVRSALGPPPLLAKGGLYSEAQSELARLGNLTCDDLQKAIAARAYQARRPEAATRRIIPAPTWRPEVATRRLAGELRQMTKSFAPVSRRTTPDRPAPSMGRQILAARRLLADARDRGELTARDVHRADVQLRLLATQQLARTGGTRA